MYLVTPKQMKELEQMSDENHVSFEALMENAGFELYKIIKDVCTKNNNDASIVLLAGNGNNGGDCFVAARYLSLDKFNVKVLLVNGQPKTELSSIEIKSIGNALLIDNCDDVSDIISNADIIVDGVFGTGFHGELPENIKHIFSIKTNAVKIAVDVPSGGACNSGNVSDGTFLADFTVTFAFKKVGMEQYPLKSYCGKVVAADIGIPINYISKLDLPIRTITDEMAKGILPERKPDSHKGDFGRLFCLTGSGRMGGAGIMSAMSAARCGAGLITATCEKSVKTAMLMSVPEVMPLELKTDSNGFYTYENIDLIMEYINKSDAVLLGCGMGVTEDTKKITAYIIKNTNCPIIIDADGINCIKDSIDIIKDCKSSIIITPHPAEFARLTGYETKEIQKNRFEIAREFSEKYPKVTLVLKGAGTIVSDFEKVFVNTNGNSGMSKGGSGDILSGMIASFTAQGIENINSAVLGVFMHGKAGDFAANKYSQAAMLPTDIIKELSKVFKEF